MHLKKLTVLAVLSFFLVSLAAAQIVSDIKLGDTTKTAIDASTKTTLETELKDGEKITTLSVTNEAVLNDVHLIDATINGKQGKILMGAGKYSEYKTITDNTKLKAVK